MYKVLRTFADLQDNKYLYHAGDVYPRDGLAVRAERFHELSSRNNSAGVVLIEYAPEGSQILSGEVSAEDDNIPRARAKTVSKKPRKRKES